ncbi:MAG: hypothetical protein ACLQVN_13000 [Bryobacteraceae bacterium]
MIRRYFWLGILAALFSTISGFNKGWIGGFTANLGAGFVGSLLTVVLIDRAIESAQTQQSRRVMIAALNRLRPKLVSQLTFLFDLHKASAVAKPAVAPANLADLFTEAYYESVRRLDFSKPAPINPPASWFAFSGHCVREFTDSLERMLDTYVAFLGPENIEILERLLSSTVAMTFPQFAWLEQRELNEGRRLPPRLLSGDDMIEVLRQYVNATMGLVTQFNKHAHQPISVSDLSLWRADVSPAIGSARFPAR